MKLWVITVARKPLDGTVADNVAKWGTGGINIDGSRVGTVDSLDGGAYAKNPTPRAGKDLWTAQRKGDTQCFKRGGAGEYEQPSGRWPANLILQHRPGCTRVGTVQIRGHRGYPHGPGGVYSHNYQKSSDRAQEWNAFSTREDNQPWAGHANEDGTEEIDNWQCEPGCPISDLGVQSGESKSVQRLVTGPTNPQGYRGGASNRSKGGSGGAFNKTDPYLGGHDDDGTAARFFKQVKDNED